MINYNYETDFSLGNELSFTNWILRIIAHHQYEIGEINYIFCNDEYLHKINVEFLNHDTLTDIITFDNSLGKEIHSDIFISVERVKDNAQDYDVSFDEELKRVMIHGILHLVGFKDKTTTEANKMRELENNAINMFHVEQ